MYLFRCKICSNENFIQGIDTLLSNGEFVHNNCYKKLLDKITEGDSQIKHIESEINSITHKIDILRYELANYSKTLDLTTRVSVLIFGKNKLLKEKENHLHKQIYDLNNLISNKKSLRELKKSDWIKQRNEIQINLAAIYDFWPTYPPDWNIRTENLRKYGYCAKCCITRDEITNENKKRFKVNLRSLQVHHLKPLKDGGNNKPENLILICNKCHEKIHGFSINNNNKPKDIRSQFTEKIDLINSAIKNQKRIQITYVDFSKNTSKRIVIPNLITDKLDGKPNSRDNLYLVGFCETRMEIRHFTISKIRTIYII